jgi:solute carrier family 25 (mitochondrial adenine nucleotide translocator), member 4/5/6/31
MFAVVTICSEMMAYPIDTVRRRMMMTSGEKVKYRGSLDCAMHIVKNEGAMALMKGAGKFLLC